MVKFTASLVGAAAVLARVASAVPMEYGAESSSTAAPSYQTTSAYELGSGYEGGDYSSSAPEASYTPSSYGSGYSDWNKGGYDDCVQQCVAKFGSPSTMYMPPSMTTDAGNNADGKTHTVWVAPTQGVLRYVPFAVNASVGDTVKFIWGANKHTVTKSSTLGLCNMTDDRFFTSGEQNQTFTFTQLVNDTDPTFFYCGTPTHCQKGMFGIINPPNAWAQPSSAGMMMPELAKEYPSTQAAWSYASNVTANETAAARWGDSIDLSKMPEWAQTYAAENIAYTKSFLAMNPETMSQGTVDLTPLASNPIMIPTDVAAAARLTTDNTTSTPSDDVSSTSTDAPEVTNPAAAAKSNGAGALSSPRVAAALVAIAAAFFAL